MYAPPALPCCWQRTPLPDPALPCCWHSTPLPDSTLSCCPPTALAVDTINATSIEAAALLVARSVHVLALGDTPPFPPLLVNYTAVQQTVSAAQQFLFSALGILCMVRPD